MRNPFFAPEEFTKGDLTVRMYREADAVALNEAVTESYDHLRPWMPWANPTQSLDETRGLIRQFTAKYLTNEDFGIGIWSENDGYLGGSGFHLRGGSIDPAVGEIGMWIRSSQAGKGWGSRALKVMLEWGFEHWEWERLFWRCDVRNDASARVAEKCGMKLEGTMRSDALDVEGNRRDTRVYALIRADWPLVG